VDCCDNRGSGVRPRILRTSAAQAAGRTEPTSAQQAGAYDLWIGSGARRHGLLAAGTTTSTRYSAADELAQDQGKDLDADVARAHPETTWRASCDPRDGVDRLFGEGRKNPGTAEAVTPQRSGSPSRVRARDVGIRPIPRQRYASEGTSSLFSPSGHLRCLHGSRRRPGIVRRAVSGTGQDASGEEGSDIRMSPLTGLKAERSTSRHCARWDGRGGVCIGREPPSAGVQQPLTKLGPRGSDVYVTDLCGTMVDTFL
jgi:hypothetical protein